MGAQMTIPNHHHMSGQPQVSVESSVITINGIIQPKPPQVHQNPHSMGGGGGMYTNTGPVGGPPQSLMHQQQQLGHQGQPQQQPPPSQQSAPASLASPLYPWMRSQFGECELITIH